MEHVKEIRVGVASFPPLVKERNGKFEGFEIELFEHVCQQLGYSPTYVLHEFKDLLPALKQGNVQIGIAGITRTEAREREFDFSHRTLDSGLSILVPRKMESTLFTALNAFFSKDMLKIFILLFLFIVASAHLVWLAERGAAGSIQEAYLPGIFEAMWWSVVTVSTVGYGDFYPVTWLGRLAGTLIILSGLAVFGLYIGKISSSLTIERLRSSIHSKDDLRNKKIATLRGTEVVSELQPLGSVVVESANMDDTYVELDKQRVDAVVFDTPVLQHHVKVDTAHRHAIVGAQFRPQTYGFAFQQGDPLSEEVNRVLFHLRETGVYEQIYNKWF